MSLSHEIYYVAEKGADNEKACLDFLKTKGNIEIGTAKNSYQTEQYLKRWNAWISANVESEDDDETKLTVILNIVYTAGSEPIITPPIADVVRFAINLEIPVYAISRCVDRVSFQFRKVRRIRVRGLKTLEQRLIFTDQSFNISQVFPEHETSGYDGKHIEWSDERNFDSSPQWTPEEILRREAARTPTLSPGVAYRYLNR